jgi:hypothetical protein
LTPAAGSLWLSFPCSTPKWSACRPTQASSRVRCWSLRSSRYPCPVVCSWPCSFPTHSGSLSHHAHRCLQQSTSVESEQTLSWITSSSNLEGSSCYPARAGLVCDLRRRTNERLSARRTKHQRLFEPNESGEPEVWSYCRCCRCCCS